MIRTSGNEQPVPRILFKAVIAAVAGVAVWTSSHERIDSWLAGLAVALAMVAIFRFIPPQPRRAPRRNAWIALAAAVIGALLGWSVERWL